MPRPGSHLTAIPCPARLWVLQLQDDKRVLVPASSLLLVDFELRQRAEVRAAAALELLPAELLVGGGSQAGQAMYSLRVPVVLSPQCDLCLLPLLRCRMHKIFRRREGARLSFKLTFAAAPPTASHRAADQGLPI